MILVTHGVPTFLRFNHPRLGRLLTPRMPDSLARTVAAGIPWAADNDAFNGFKEDAYVAMLDKIEGWSGCRFVTAPDVVADAAATLDLFAEWRKTLRDLGHPVALVAQDGLEHLAVPWDDLDAMFIGGSTDWKLGRHAAALTAEAKRRGKWVHMGRVNTRRRIDIAKAWGCDSIDGTQFSRFRDTHLPWALDRLAAPPQQFLEGVA